MARVIGSGRVTRKSHQPPTPQPTVEIASRNDIEPLYQGDLALCGLYAAANALRLALQGHAPMSKARAKKLAHVGFGYLDRRGLLLDAICSGMETKDWHKLIRRLAREVSTQKLSVELERPKLGRKSTIDDVFTWIEDSLADGKPVLICLGAGLNHFAVIAGIDESRVHLFDSAGFKFVKRSCCGIGERFHHIAPKALIRVAVRRR